jgi:hypothetical protein
MVVLEVWLYVFVSPLVSVEAEEGVGFVEES